jgi:hypothetical protein
VRVCAHADRAGCGRLVFIRFAGTHVDAHNVRRDFCKVVVMEAPGLPAGVCPDRRRKVALAASAVEVGPMRAIDAGQ